MQKHKQNPLAKKRSRPAQQRQADDELSYIPIDATRADSSSSNATSQNYLVDTGLARAASPVQTSATSSNNAASQNPPVMHGFKQRLKQHHLDALNFTKNSSIDEIRSYRKQAMHEMIQVHSQCIAEKREDTLAKGRAPHVQEVYNNKLLSFTLAMLEKALARHPMENKHLILEKSRKIFTEGASLTGEELPGGFWKKDPKAATSVNTHLKLSNQHWSEDQDRTELVRQANDLVAKNL